MQLIKMLNFKSYIKIHMFKQKWNFQISLLMPLKIKKYLQIIKKYKIWHRNRLNNIYNNRFKIVCIIVY